VDAMSSHHAVTAVRAHGYAWVIRNNDSGTLLCDTKYRCMVTVGLYEIEIVCVFWGEDARDVRFA
jgi:hypothetical protein